MLIGGIIIAPLVWIITYYIIYSFIASYKKEKVKKTESYFNEKVYQIRNKY